LLEISPKILPIEDEAISNAMHDCFSARGIEISVSIEGVERIEKRDGDLLLHYRQEGKDHALPVEAVIFAVGWAGNVEPLNLDAAGVRSERGYISVDQYLRTTAEHIFAAGDITGRMMLVQSGSAEGRIAAENAVLGPGHPYSHEVVPHGGFTDPEYASVGLIEAKLQESGEAYTAAVVPYAELDRAVIDGHTEGLFKLLVSNETHRILGAHAVGEQAVEVVQIAAAGMAADMWVEQLAEMELAYPTFTAILGLAARRIIHQLGVMPLAPQWRALGKHHMAERERIE
jgi:pyruvate/2-oxoglutarate dehydrogenase complex dihydrolipoamide dehydrogenase (E3) component